MLFEKYICFLSFQNYTIYTDYKNYLTSFDAVAVREFCYNRHFFYFCES